MRQRRLADPDQVSQDFLTLHSQTLLALQSSVEDRTKLDSPLPFVQVAKETEARLNRDLSTVGATDSMGSRLPDWYSLYCYEFLRGLGDPPAEHISGDELEGLRLSARVWGGRLVETMGGILRQFRLFRDLAGLIVDILEHMPDEFMVDRMQILLSPQYLRGLARQDYFSALFKGDTAGAREAMTRLKETDEELMAEVDRQKRSGDLLPLCRDTRARLSEAFSGFIDLGGEITDQDYEELLRRAMGLIAFQIGMELRRTLIMDPLKARAVLEALKNSREAHALDEEYKARYEWGGDHSQAVVIVFGITGPRQFSLDREEPIWQSDEEKEKEAAEIVGAWQGLRDYTNQRSADQALAGALRGEFTPYVRKARKNEMADRIRRKNRLKGIDVPEEWSQEGLTEDQIRQRQKNDMDGLSGVEVSDRDIELPEEGSVRLLDLAVEEHSLRTYQEEEVEEQRRAFLKDRLEGLCTGTKLTPRQKIVKELYDKSDEAIASSLEKRFGKPFTTISVRALRHDLVMKLRRKARKK